HRDFSRAFERAVLRARVPMAYSSGFHPHPRISYAGAAPTGSASEAEYLEPVRSAAQALLDAPEVKVSRMTKKGLREFDVRAALVSLGVTASGETCVILDMV